MNFSDLLSTVFCYSKHVRVSEARGQALSQLRTQGRNWGVVPPRYYAKSFSKVVALDYVPLANNTSC